MTDEVIAVSAVPGVGNWIAGRVSGQSTTDGVWWLETSSLTGRPSIGDKHFWMRGGVMVSSGIW